ncbi:MAG: hypothetical protein ACR652_13680 [Methylocystis sp.]|uniref:hypothetical protein n=1 Tax=Methylocystis sp. TaxID=1911079 RepID=UPI003DA5CC88
MRGGIALADMSANIFAALALLLIGALAIGGGETDGAAENVERHALGGEEMVDLLYGRRDPGGESIIDVFEDRAEIFGQPGRASIAPPDPQAIAAALPPGRAVAVFVFAHGAYRAAFQGLKARGVPWREISVPLALRDESGDGWSSAFLALVERAPSREDFRIGLARLLTGGAARGAGAAPPVRGMTLPAEFSKLIRLMETLVALSGCALLARWAERRP